MLSSQRPCKTLALYALIPEHEPHRPERLRHLATSPPSQTSHSHHRTEECSTGKQQVQIAFLQSTLHLIRAVVIKLASRLQREQGVLLQPDRLCRTILEHWHVTCSTSHETTPNADRSFLDGHCTCMCCLHSSSWGIHSISCIHATSPQGTCRAVLMYMCLCSICGLICTWVHPAHS